MQNKVLYLLGILNAGGKERLLLDVFGQGKDLPFAPYCVYRRHGQLEAQYQQTGIPLQHIPSKSPITYLWKLRKYVRANKIDIIHAQSSYDALLAALATLGIRIPIVQTQHGYRISTRFKGRLHDKTALRLCKKTVFVSQQQMEHYAQGYQLTAKQRRKLAVVYNGIDFSRFPMVSHAISSPVKMAMVGNFVPAKSQLELCKYLKQMRQKGCQFDFSFVGGRVDNAGRMYDKCVEYCSENGLNDCVHFLGSCSNVPQILEQMDAFVYNSKSETFGLAIIEAISMGLPAFVNDLEVLKEITHQGELATLFRTGDEEDFLTKITDFLQHPDPYIESAKKAAETVRNQYAIQNHTQNLYNIYNS